jgi:diguanylate cyclase (GGDEF)-like protein
MSGLLTVDALERVISSWRRAVRFDPLLSRVLTPDLRTFAVAFNDALTGDSSGNLEKACSDLVGERLDAVMVIRLTTQLADIIVDEHGIKSGAQTKSIVGTLGHVCGLLADRMVSDVTTISRRDDLTGIENRRAWDEALAGLLSREGLITIAMVDLDGLKHINDSQGHEAGNEHLKRFAADLSGNMPERARAFRLSGDEFAVLMASAPSSSLERALALLFARDSTARFSYGIATTEGGERTPTELMKTADERMYRMKAAHKATEKPQRAMRAKTSTARTIRPKKSKARKTPTARKSPTVVKRPGAAAPGRPKNTA